MLKIHFIFWIFGIIAQAERPKSARNSCVIERICSVFVSFHLSIVCR